MDLFSPAWFDRLEERLISVSVGSAGQPGLALGQVVNGTPGGMVSYTIHLGAGKPGSLDRDSIADATVILVEDFASALGIFEGASVTDLLSSGKIKIRGDVNALLGATEELAALTDALLPTI